MDPKNSFNPIQLSAQAATILEKDRNAYWRPRAPDIRVEAVAFADAAFLAGPFDERFGLVYIAYEPTAKPRQEQLDEAEAKVLAERSTVYLPYAAFERIRARFPQGVNFHWDPTTQSSYSELDLPHLTEEVRTRLESKDRSGAFAQTEAGRAELFKGVTPEEHAQHQANLAAAVARIHIEMRGTERCAEKPYSVRLQGNDDASWTATCANLDEVETLLNALRRSGYAAVREHMHFTN